MTANLAFVVMMAVWACAELALVLWARATDAKDSHRDAGTLPIVIVAIAIALGGGAWFTSSGIGAWPDACLSVLRWMGATCIAVGLAIRWTAVLTLRRYFTVTVAIRADHKLVDWGLYRYVRHPSYSGAMVALFGLSVGSGNWLAGFTIAIPIVWAVAMRIRAEEQALAEGLGSAYADWCGRTPRLFPRLFSK